MIYFLCNLLLVSLQNVCKIGRGNRRQQLKLRFQRLGSWQIAYGLRQVSAA